MQIQYEQEFELYHWGESLCAQKARVGLLEKNIDHKLHQINLCGFGDSNSTRLDNLSEEYLKINPKGVVPTLVHKGEPVYDGHFIVKYVDGLHPDRGEHLWPADEALQDPAQNWFDNGMLKDHAPEDAFGTAIAMFSTPILQRLLQMQSTAWLQESLSRHPEKYKIDLYMGMHHATDAPPPPQSSMDALCRGLILANRNLGDFGGPWLLGDFSMADITLMACFHRLEDAHLDAILFDEHLGALGDYWLNLQKRPSYGQGILAWHDEQYWRNAIEDVYGDKPSPMLEGVRKRLHEMLS